MNNSTPTKFCRKCQRILPTSEFYKSNRTTDGLREYCIDCQYVYKGRARPPRKNIAPAGMKYCTKCGCLLPATLKYFNQNKRQRSGLHPQCRQCRMAARRGVPESEVSKLKRLAYRECNRERERERARRWRSIESNRQRALESSRRFHAEHPEWRKNWQSRNSDHVREYNRKYRKQHHSRWLVVAGISNSRRRARKRNLPNTLTDIEWQHALEYFSYRCAVCGRPPGLWHTLAQDHWIPLNDNRCTGTTANNIIPLCHGEDGCNNSKHDRDPMEWLTKKYGKRKARQIAARIEAYFASLANHEEPPH